MSDHLIPASGMPHTPAPGPATEFMVAVPSIAGGPHYYRTDYRTDGVRKPTCGEAIAHGLAAEGHDDWLIANVSGDRLLGLAWQHEDRDDGEEVEEAAAALGLTAAFTMPVPAAQPLASGPETSGTGSGRGTGERKAHARSEAAGGGDD